MWFHTLNTALHQLNFTQAKSDYALFFQKQGDTITIILAYVDNLLITKNNINKINELNSKFFQIKDLGCLKYFFGLEFSYTFTNIYVGQKKYTLDLLDITYYMHSKPTNALASPATPHTNYIK